MATTVQNNINQQNYHDIEKVDRTPAENIVPQFLLPVTKEISDLRERLQPPKIKKKTNTFLSNTRVKKIKKPFLVY